MDLAAQRGQPAGQRRADEARGPGDEETLSGEIHLYHLRVAGSRQPICNLILTGHPSGGN